MFPLEFKPGHYLVRSCDNGRADWPCTDIGFNEQWVWVHNGEPVQIREGGDPLFYGQPNVVEDRGFFWFTTFEGPRFIVTSFTGHQLEPPVLPFDENTSGIECDQTLGRCLLRYMRDVAADQQIVYAFKVLHRGESCDVSEPSGYGDEFSLTPEGLASVTSASRKAHMQRAAVVMRFQPGQCEPTSVEFHPFDA